MEIDLRKQLQSIARTTTHTAPLTAIDIIDGYDSLLTDLIAEMRKSDDVAHCMDWYQVRHARIQDMS